VLNKALGLLEGAGVPLPVLVEDGRLLGAETLTELFDLQPQAKLVVEG
jgi:hypothetical protein